ncbi:MAG TPA: class I SAM-dependent RNA methyltransferase [Gemmatimonadaceae bacterium]|nr:class I SAM-dependent RNA methyltransferase [Gemmatimonadaceae bacterium]
MTTATSSQTRFDLFAQTAPGLEPVTAAELKGLKLKPRKEPGGVAFRGDLEQLYEANLWLRTATRIVVRVGSFYASTFAELERRAQKIAWENFLPRDGFVRVRVTCRKSRLYHSDAVAERILKAIIRVAPRGVKMASADEGADDGGTADEGSPNEAGSQLFIVRIVNDQCEISADSSGALLHRRGYRLEVAKAPLRETLAAAMVLACGWTGGSDLLDPLCGSGTIPIEAALIARRVAPGMNRDFQFSHWPSFSSGTWDRVRDRARARAIPVGESRIVGADRDAGAIEAAKRNATRAGVADSVEFETSSLSGSIAGIPDTRPSGWILTNPPYGIRVGESGELRNLYATLGSASLKSGWNLGILSTDEALARQLKLPLRRRLRTQNGGIPVDFLVSKKVSESAESFEDAGVENETRNV